MFFFRRIFSKAWDNNPIVFIPGLFGSMGNDIIPGTGDFDFGFAEFAYRPIVKNLEGMGYEEGKNLFIAYYDWRKRNQYSAQKYLVPVIEKAKETTGSKKVNIICHSMGGIVARAYIQSSFYNYDIDKVIMIGTPNSGAPDAYYFWSGGEIPYDRVRENFLYRIIREGFLLLYKLIYGISDDVKILRQLFPSVQDLLPSHNYGDFIFYENERNEKRFISIEHMEAQNEFINNLNKEYASLYRYGIKFYLIAGKGIETDRFICVDRNHKEREKWIDGKPLYTIKTYSGDGTVTCDSVKGIYGRTFYLKSDHIEILNDCAPILTNILGRRYSEKVETIINTDKHKVIYNIIVNNIKRVELKHTNTKILIQNGKVIGGKQIVVREIGKNNYWIMFKLNKLESLEASFTPLYKGSNAYIYTCEKNKPIRKFEKLGINNILTIKL